MLPCQTSCPHYAAGCHKTCAAWRRFQQRQQAANEAKRRYLRHHNQVCATMVRQFRAMTPSRSVW